MNRFVLIGLFVLATALSVNALVYFNESFDDGIPYGWATIGTNPSSYWHAIMAEGIIEGIGDGPSPNEENAVLKSFYFDIPVTTTIRYTFMHRGTAVLPANTQVLFNIGLGGSPTCVGINPVYNGTWTECTGTAIAEAGSNYEVLLMVLAHDGGNVHWQIDDFLMCDESETIVTPASLGSIKASFK